MGSAEANIINYALGTNDSDRTLSMLGVADIDVRNAVFWIH
tara:strand:+ start:1766 stop:1888 length:123 start_codon:yes stop_codon:yes gene_type:complete